MKTKILFPFEGDVDIGGSHVSAMNLAVSLDRSVYEPHILIHYDAGPAAEYAKSLGLDFEVLEEPRLMSPRGLKYPRDLGAGGYLASSVWRLAAIVSRIQPDIVHTNEGRMHANWVLPTKLAGKKHVWHHRQGPTAFGVNKLAPLFSDHIISVSHFSKPANPVRSVDHKISVVRSPFDFPKEVPDRDTARTMILKELGLPGNAILLGYFGNLITRKRPDHFVAAIAETQKEIGNAPVHGLLFGSVSKQDAPLFENCLSLAEALGIQDQIHMMGFRQPITDYMAGMDATLVTALDEPFGRTLIEAMYLGAPVIATRHGGNPEAIQDGVNGFLVDPVDPVAFAAPVKRLIDDTALQQRIVAEAHRYAKDNFGLAVHVDSVCRIYDGLTNNRP